MKKKIINGLLIAVVLVAATSSFVSCKDYDADNYNELQAKYLSLQDAFNKQVAAMQDYVLTSRYNAETGYDAALAASKGTIAKRLDDLEKDTASLADRITKNKIAIAEAKAIAENARDLAKQDSTWISNMLKVAYGTDIDNAVEQAANLLATLVNDTAKWYEAYDSIKARSVEWNKAVELAEKAEAFLDPIYDEEGHEITKLSDLVKAYERADDAMKEDIAALQQDVKNIMKLIQQEVTGIEIQATYNPIFGTFSYPIGVQSNILGAYYGICGVQLVKFPAGDRTPAQIASWATQAPAITSDELDDIYDGEYFVREENDTLMLEGAGNAGKLYLTVNPSNVKFDDSYFTLRASDNTVSKVLLSPVKACTEQLKWGYNRAAAENSSNGFYVATAQIKKEEANDVALSFNLKGMAKQIQNMMNDWSSTSASDIAKLALTIHDGLKTNVPRLGVQYQWKDAVSGDWKNYVSKYDIAAVSVKPLGFDFLLTKDEDGNVVPMDFSQGIVKFKNKLTAKEQALGQEILALLKVSIDIPAGATGDIEKTADGKYILTVTVKNGQFGGYDAAGNPQPVVDFTALETALSGAGVGYTPYIGEVYLPKGDTKIPVDITALFTALKNVETALGKASDKIENYIEKLINLQNKIFGKAEAFASNVNRYIQPALIGKCNQFNGYFYPSRDYLAPTQIKKGQKIMLYPTTLTGEIVAPAFKKYVAISGVWKVSDISSTDKAKDANDAVNAAAGKKCLNTVFDGAEFNIQNGFEINTGELKAGYVYEFIYECLGYNGMVAGKKYYIEVYE